MRRDAARVQFRRWLADPHSPGFRPAEYDTEHGRIYRVRLAGGYRAVAVRDGNRFDWFFIGTHAEYESRFGLNR